MYAVKTVIGCKYKQSLDFRKINPIKVTILYIFNDMDDVLRRLKRAINWLIFQEVAENETELAEKLGYRKSCNITDRNNEQGKIYTWTSDKYEIALLFGSDGRCIGVNKETRI